MGCDTNKAKIIVTHISFNPRTHMGCDQSKADNYAMQLVSIHAPIWGATLLTLLMVICFLSFNPRTHMGCDSVSHIYNTMLFMVSIHAPIWGATLTGSNLTVTIPWFQSTHPYGVRLYGLTSDGVNLGFNPRTHMGCDFRTYHEIIFALMFQSTHPYGVRLRVCSPYGSF